MRQLISWDSAPRILHTQVLDAWAKMGNPAGANRLPRWVLEKPVLAGEFR
jgi:hypothetical protein